MENRENLKRSIDNITVITESLKNELPSLIRKIDRVAQNLEAITGENREDIRDLIKNLKETSIALREKTPQVLDEISQAAKVIKGTVGENREDIKIAIKKIKDASEKLDKILAKIDEGKGTLGKLVNDDSLEDEKAGIAGRLAPGEKSYIYVGLLTNSNGSVSRQEDIRSDSTTTRIVKRDYGILFDVQYAHRILKLWEKSLWIRGGLKDSTGAVGLDLYFSDNLTVKADLYNFDRKYGLGFMFRDDDIKYLIGSVPKP